MADTTSIEWCDSTGNYWEGCTRTSEARNGGGGCDNCYAERMNVWLRRGENWGPGAPRRRILTTPTIVAAWQRSAAKFRAAHGRDRRVFVNSISDWLDNQVPIDWLVDMLESMRQAPDVTFLLLSKRIGNWAGRISHAIGYLDEQTPAAYPLPLRAWLCHWLDGDDAPRNVWIGATVVNQAEVDRDVPKLLRVPAVVRFLSVEPMLGPIDLTSIKRPGSAGVMRPLDGRFNRLHQVICGGESGPKARPMHPDWARSLRDQCEAAGVPFLFKQWGRWREADDSGLPGVRTIVDGDPEWDTQAAKCDAFMALDGELITDLDDARAGVPYRGLERLDKKAAGRLLDGRTHDEFPAP